eukprot:NODE_2322_length_625_cov_70.348958_g1971_i0.p1 GENE.NODE_2322_length_625_cov_70.348958_g1971_i0~~NODE_2322_length_625_cov_70.348958_g1971_i0.p1  ORF type:complete len:160 (-),score=26.94 NODE_2322_length_625_cov_70.348958_g1971_i0:146-601(-)
MGFVGSHLVQASKDNPELLKEFHNYAAESGMAVQGPPPRARLTASPPEPAYAAAAGSPSQAASDLRQITNATVPLASTSSSGIFGTAAGYAGRLLGAARGMGTVPQVEDVTNQPHLQQAPAGLPGSVANSSSSASVLPDDLQQQLARLRSR